MIILTDEANLIRGHENKAKNSNKTLNNSINLLFDQMDNYQFEFKIIRDYSNINDSINQKNLCYTDMMKTSEREKSFYFSNPFTLYLSLRVFSKTPLPSNLDNNVNLSHLLNESINNKIGIVMDRSFGLTIDQQIATLDENQLVRIPAELDSILATFNHNRFDFLIEYPQYVNLHWPSLTDERLYSYPIIGGKPYTIGHMMCTKTAINKKFIAQFNQSIESSGRSGALFNALSSEINDDKRAEFERYFREVFTYQGPHH